MERNIAIRKINSIIESNLDVHHVGHDDGCGEAMRSAISDLTGLVNEVYDDFEWSMTQQKRGVAESEESEELEE